MAENDIEVTALAYAKAFYGENFDPFMNPEAFDLARKATVSALTTLRSTTAELNPAPAAAADGELRAVLRKLSGNAGALGFAKHEICEAVGYTNWQCLMDAVAEADALLTHPTDSAAKDAENDAFTHGYLIALSNLVAGYGATDYAEYLLRDLGKISADDMTRLNMSEFDCNNLAPVFAALANRGDAGSLAKERGE